MLTRTELIYLHAFPPYVVSIFKYSHTSLVHGYAMSAERVSNKVRMALILLQLLY